ncbi:hypothetical protein NHJ6243_003307 [Beauveria neobassiana]
MASQGHGAHIFSSFINRQVPELRGSLRASEHLYHARREQQQQQQQQQQPGVDNHITSMNPGVKRLDHTIRNLPIKYDRMSR